MTRDPTADAEAILRSAIAAADPAAPVTAALARAPEFAHVPNITMIAAGKAACGMARAARTFLGDRITAAVTIVPRGTPCDGALHAAHPLPDDTSAAAARAVHDLLAATPADAAALVLLSGGASALIALPIAPVAMPDYADCVRNLQHAGADIAALNTVRRHIDAVKGGRLALRTRPRPTLVLLASDVIDDDLATIASGPFAPDTSSFRDALDVLARYRVSDRCAASMRDLLERGAAGQIDETPDDPRAFHHVRHEVVVDNRRARLAARDAAADRGYHTHMLDTPVTGEARVAGPALVALMKRLLRSRTTDAPLCLIAGGETTVTVTGSGRGGRNHELVLAAALTLDNRDSITIASAGTDGVDGTADAAGAVADARLIARARLDGLDPAAFLADNDSFTLFDRLDACIRTGPTHTNVMDVHVLLAT